MERTYINGAEAKTILKLNICYHVHFELIDRMDILKKYSHQTSDLMPRDMPLISAYINEDKAEAEREFKIWLNQKSKTEILPLKLDMAINPFIDDRLSLNEVIHYIHDYMDKLVAFIYDMQNRYKHRDIVIYMSNLDVLIQRLEHYGLFNNANQNNIVRDIFKVTFHEWTQKSYVFIPTEEETLSKFIGKDIALERRINLLRKYKKSC